MKLASAAATNDLRIHPRAAIGRYGDPVVAWPVCSSSIFHTPLRSISVARFSCAVPFSINAAFKTAIPSEVGMPRQRLMHQTHDECRARSTRFWCGWTIPVPPRIDKVTSITIPASTRATVLGSGIACTSMTAALAIEANANNVTDPSRPMARMRRNCGPRPQRKSVDACFMEQFLLFDRCRPCLVKVQRQSWRRAGPRSASVRRSLPTRPCSACPISSYRRARSADSARCSHPGPRGRRCRPARPVVD